jgi:hypothetical protein
MTLPKINRTRIDDMPGDATLDALALAAEMIPTYQQLRFTWTRSFNGMSDAISIF